MMDDVSTWFEYSILCRLSAVPMVEDGIAINKITMAV